MDRRKFFQFSGVAALAGASGAAGMYFGARRFGAATPVSPYPFDPIRVENFQQKLFIPGGSGPFGVLDVGGPLTAASPASSWWKTKISAG